MAACRLCPVVVDAECRCPQDSPLSMAQHRASTPRSRDRAGAAENAKTREDTRRPMRTHGARISFTPATHAVYLYKEVRSTAIQLYAPIRSMHANRSLQRLRRMSHTNGRRRPARTTRLINYKQLAFLDSTNLFAYHATGYLRPRLTVEIRQIMKFGVATLMHL